LAGIPSVVYGFFDGYRALNSKSFGLPVGETVLVGSVVLAIMLFTYYYHYLRGRNAQHTACHERS
jgi:ABC-type phosphate transport system permease subunit